MQEKKIGKLSGKVNRGAKPTPGQLEFLTFPFFLAFVCVVWESRKKNVKKIDKLCFDKHDDGPEEEGEPWKAKASNELLLVRR